MDFFRWDTKCGQPEGEEHSNLRRVALARVDIGGQVFELEVQSKMVTASIKQWRTVGDLAADATGVWGWGGWESLREAKLRGMWWATQKLEELANVSFGTGIGNAPVRIVTRGQVQRLDKFGDDAVIGAYMVTSVGTFNVAQMAGGGWRVVRQMLPDDAQFPGGWQVLDESAPEVNGYWVLCPTIWDAMQTAHSWSRELALHTTGTPEEEAMPVEVPPVEAMPIDEMPVEVPPVVERAMPAVRAPDGVVRRADGLFVGENHGWRAFQDGHVWVRMPRVGGTYIQAVVTYLPTDNVGEPWRVEVRVGKAFANEFDYNPGFPVVIDETTWWLFDGRAASKTAAQREAERRIAVSRMRLGKKGL